MPPPPHCALHYSIDPVTSLQKSITLAPLMNAPNIAVNRADDPGPCHVLGNEVNELTEKSACAGEEGCDSIWGGRGWNWDFVDGGLT